MSHKCLILGKCHQPTSPPEMSPPRQGNSSRYAMTQIKPCWTAMAGVSISCHLLLQGHKRLPRQLPTLFVRIWDTTRWLQTQASGAWWPDGALLSHLDPWTPHQSMRFQAVCPDKGSPQSLPYQRGEGCPDVWLVDLATNRSLCDHHGSLYQWGMGACYLSLTNSGHTWQKPEEGSHSVGNNRKGSCNCHGQRVM